MQAFNVSFSLKHLRLLLCLSSLSFSITQTAPLFKCVTIISCVHNCLYSIQNFPPNPRHSTASLTVSISHISSVNVQSRNFVPPFHVRITENALTSRSALSDGADELSRRRSGRQSVNHILAVALFRRLSAFPGMIISTRNRPTNLGGESAANDDRYAPTSRPLGI